MESGLQLPYIICPSFVLIFTFIPVHNSLLIMPAILKPKTHTHTIHVLTSHHITCQHISNLAAFVSAELGKIFYSALYVWLRI